MTQFTGKVWLLGDDIDTDIIIPTEYLARPGVEDMNAALALKGRDLYIRREDLRLGEGEYFDDELLGLDVYSADSGECLGELVAVESYPAHKLYTVRGQREFLVPAVKDVFIQSVDLEDNRMEIHVWEGMTADEN